MTTRRSTFVFWLWAAALIPALAWAAEGGDLAARLKAAKPGDTVELPAGEFRAGVTVPAGVTLKGAGHDLTILDADGADAGVTIEGDGATVSDLTVRGATGPNVTLQDAANAVVARVRVTGGLIGVSLADASHCRIENVVSDANRYGVVVTGGEGNAVVNCSVVGNAGLGLSFPSGKGHVAFNNVVADSATGIYIGDTATDLHIDHNLYFCLFAGKYHSELGRAPLFDWAYLSGQDRHSISMPVTFEDQAAGKLTPTNALSWVQDRTAASGWGATELAGHKAPAQDITGAPRPDAPGLGTFEATVQPTRPADGVLDVPAGDADDSRGVVSAGVYAPDGRLVTFLFNDLPVRAGQHSFWLPSRDDALRPIAAGDYEVRVVRSNLQWEYVGTVGNTMDRGMNTGGAAPAGIEHLTFDHDGNLIIGRGHSEEHITFRSFEGKTGTWRWYLPGSSELTGVAAGKDEQIYALRVTEKETRITRHHPDTGAPATWKEGDFGQRILQPRHLTGLTILGDRVVYADAPGNALWFATLKDLDPTNKLDLPAPRCLSADNKTDVVWMLLGDAVVAAISQDGRVLATAQPAPQPLALAARDGRLAVASAQTGKVHLFDASDPENLKEIATLGKGDGPTGMIDVERFRFQNKAVPALLAMGPDGLLAVGDGNRVSVFDRDGKHLWHMFAIPGSGTIPSNLKPGRLFANGCTLLLDTQKNTWEPEVYSPLIRHVVGDFQRDGKSFLLLNGSAQPGTDGTFFEIVRFEPPEVTLLMRVELDVGRRQYVVRKDTNGDGAIDAKDAAELLQQLPPEGHLPMMIDYRFNTMLSDGTLLVAGSARGSGWIHRWTCAGLDDKGIPIYRWQDRVPVPNAGPDNFISPYTGKPENPGFSANTLLRDGGGYIGLTMPASTPAKSLLNNGGSEVTAVMDNGTVLWTRPFGARFPKVGGLAAGHGVYVAAMGESANMLCFTADGLGLGGFSLPQKAGWEGFWLDHGESVGSFIDEQGRLNMTMCDYLNGRNHWFRLSDAKVTPGKSSLTVGAELAAALAALPAPPPIAGAAAKPATQRARVARLQQDMPVDADLIKWRKAGIKPQLILTPEMSGGITGGPRDASALVRLGYHGQNLYVQVLRFDDVITTHQPTTRAYLQDTVEMCVNGYYEGVKFNVSHTTDKGAVNIRDSWSFKPSPWIMPPDLGPVSIRILDNARDVEERKVIETIYGQDMSECKVQIIEFKVAVDETSFQGAEAAMFKLEPGATFWIGFLIDDNDEPGADVQNFLFWPVTYGTFNPKESGAIAELE